MAYELIKKIKSKEGHVENHYCTEWRNMLAIPHGYISRDLIIQDLDFLASFNRNITNDWSYYVDISNVSRVHPLNPFHLRRLRSLDKMKTYVVYTPSQITALAIRMGSWITSPDQILTDREAFEIRITKIQ